MEGISPSSVPVHGRPVAGPVLPCSYILGQLTCNSYPQCQPCCASWVMSRPALTSTAADQRCCELSWPQSDLSYNAQAKDLPILHSPQISTCPQAAAQTKDMYLAFDGNQIPAAAGQWTQMWPLEAAQARISPWPHVASPVTHIRLFLITPESPVLSLHRAHILLFPFLLQFSTTYSS